MDLQSTYFANHGASAEQKNIMIGNTAVYCFVFLVFLFFYSPSLAHPNGRTKTREQQGEIKECLNV